MAAQKRTKGKVYSPLSKNISTGHSNDDFLQHPQLGSLEVARCRVLKYGADAAFYKLVKANCAPDILQIFLANLAKDGPALDTWIGRFGFERRQLDSVTQRMRKTADDLDCLGRNGSLYLAAWPSFKHGFDPVGFRKYVSSIPESLRTFANNIDKQANHPSSKPRRHTFSNIALAHLVAYVLHRTGTPHDNEVSDLVNAVRQKKSTSRSKESIFTADALKTWRSDHAAVISHAPQMFPSLFGR